MKKITKKQQAILQYIFLIFLICLTTYLVSTTLDIKLIPYILKIVDDKYLLYGIFLVLGYILLESIILHIIINSIQKVKVRFIGFKMATMGLYYNLVTPFASGSQPIQIYALTRYGINLSKSVAIVTNKTIIFQIVVTIYCGYLTLINLNLLKTEMPTIMILVSIGLIMNIVMLFGGILIALSPKKIKIIVEFLINKLSKFEMPTIMILVSIGLIMNIVMLFGGILIALSPKKIKIIVEFLINKLSKFKILKKICEKKDEINTYIDEYNYSIKLFIKDIKTLIMSLILTIIQLTIFFSIAYCIYKAFSLNGLSYWYILTLQVFLYIAVSPIPTPGNVGANEIVFWTIFSNVFPKELMGYSVFLYVGFVYYMIIIITGVFTTYTHYNMNKYKNYSI